MGSREAIEQKRVEERLSRESEAHARAERRLQAVLDALPVGVFVADVDGSIVAANDAADRVWGGPAPLLRRPDDYDRYKGWWAETGERIGGEEWALARALREGETSTGEIIDIERFDGTRGTILNSAAPIVDEDGRLTGAVAVTQDITAQRRQQSQLADERRRVETLAREATARAAEMDSIIASIADGVVIYDADGRIVRWNEEARKLFGYPEGDLRRPMAERMQALEMTDEGGRPIPPEDLPSARALTGETVRGRVVHQSDPLTGREYWLSVSAAPIEHEGRVTGAVATILDLTREAEAVQARESLSEEIAAANRELSAIARVTDVAISTLELDELLRSLLERLVEVMEADAAVVLLAEEDVLHSYATAGLAGDAAEAYSLPFGHGFAGAIAESRRPSHLADATERDAVVSPVLREAGIRTMLGVPLVARGELLGVLHVDWRTVHPESAREVDLLQLVADRVALSIRNAQLYEERRRSEELSAALNEIDTEVNAQLDIDVILGCVVEHTVRALRADSGVMYMREDGAWHVHAAYGLPREAIGEPMRAEEIRYSAAATERPGNVVVFNELDGGRAPTDVLKRHGVRRAMDVALTVGDRTVADFAVHLHTEERRWTPLEADFLRKVGASVTLAIQNARLYEQERHVADTLQKALLSLPEHVEGLRYGSLYRSAAVRAAVGGDFYDLFEMDDDQVGILIGDVSGKGLTASTLTALVRNTVRAYVYDSDSPAVAVSKTNTVLARAVESGEFVTLLFGILDTRTGGFVYCNAGHPAGILVREGGAVDLLKATSPLVGAFEGLEWRDESISLDRRDALLLYTDGVIEARRGGELLGEERLMETVKGLHGASVERLPERVFEAVKAFAGGDLGDDVAVLAVSRD